MFIFSAGRKAYDNACKDRNYNIIVNQITSDIAGRVCLRGSTTAWKQSYQVPENVTANILKKMVKHSVNSFSLGIKVQIMSENGQLTCIVPAQLVSTLCKMSTIR